MLNHTREVTGSNPVSPINVWAKSAWMGAIGGYSMRGELNECLHGLLPAFVKG